VLDGSGLGYVVLQAVRKCVVFSWDLNEPRESIEHRSGLSELYMDRPHTEKARNVKLEVTAGLVK